MAARCPAGPDPITIRSKSKSGMNYCSRRGPNFSAGTALTVDQMEALVNSVERQFQAVGNPEFVEDVVQVVLHRLFANEHLLGHFLVLVTLRYQADDLAFALAQRRTFPGLARSTNHVARRCKLPHYRRRCVRIQ